MTPPPGGDHPPRHPTTPPSGGTAPSGLGPRRAEVRTRSRRRWRLSLRARLLLITSGLLAVGLVVSGSIVIGMLRANLVDRVDRQLRSLSGLAALLPLIAPDLPARAAPFTTRNPAANLDLITDVYVAILTPAGAVRQEVRLPAREGHGGPVLPSLAPDDVARRAQHPFDVPDRAGGGSWRVVALPRPVIPGVTTAGGDVVLAVSLDGVISTVARLRVAVLVTGAALLAVLTLTGLFAVRAGLRPLRRIEETAAAIASGDLTRRVPGAGNTEIGRLSASLNGMLTQIEHAFAARAESESRLRRFVADVSHELRTPLSGIKGFTELHRLGGLTDVDQAMARMETEATRLSHLVEDLLLLARLDEGGDALPLDLAPMDLRTLAADARLDLQALAPDRTVTLTAPEGGPPAPAPVLGDESRLRQVVTNLISNVVTHTPPGTPVEITVGTITENGTTPGTGTTGVGSAGIGTTWTGETGAGVTGSGVARVGLAGIGMTVTGVGIPAPVAVLAVTDHGPGLTAAQAARVFDRFYRTDPSRSRSTSTGAGLGLSIAHSLARAHDGALTLHTIPGHGASFVLILPAVL
ncbi:HAMP domain-containing sensor histidine kinase [Sphaerisporangium sp. B11E5]|uniref:sensor histidine kinase n=1 Tax=Sphaerisporangium sp. B11E5 TaxID=3153563 RepID=UPI00325EC804